MRFPRIAAPWGTTGNPHETQKEIAMITKRTRVVVLIGASHKAESTAGDAAPVVW